MKFNFKKISAIGASLLMAGLTAGVAAAANFPAPFVDGGVANVAVVYGTGTGVSSLDQVQAGNIQTTLGESMPSTGTTVTTDGEAFELDKDSNHFNYGDNFGSIYSTLSDNHMDFLIDGTYNDGDIDEEFSQKITLGTSDTLELFQNVDINDDEPTLGFEIEDDNTILTYEMDMDTEINYTEMVDTYLPLMGNEYYVIAAAAAQIDVLDSATKTTIEEGESLTIGGKTVSIYNIDANGVKFTVDGETVDKLTSIGDYKEIGSTDNYVVLNDWNYDTRDGRISNAEFSIGSGKIELIDGEEAELNGVDIDGLNVAFTDGSSGTSFLDTITLTWKAEDDTYLTEGSSIVMPGFEVISLAFNGLDFPSESEMVSLENGQKLTLTMDNYNLDVMYHNTEADNVTLGVKSHELILAAETSLTYAEAGYDAGDTAWTETGTVWNITLSNGTVETISTNSTLAANLTEAYLTDVLPIDDNERFIVTRIKTDITDLETLYYEVSELDSTDTTTVLALDDLIGDNDIDFSDVADDVDRGDVNVVLTAFNADNTTAYLTFTAGGDTMTYNKAVSETGLVVTLPSKATVEAVTDAGTMGAIFTFTEANEDGDVDSGAAFTANVTSNTDMNMYVGAHNVTDLEVSKDNLIGYVDSVLTSKIAYSTSGDENDYSIEYFGEEIIADVQVATGAVTMTSDGASALGDVLVTDAEINSVKDKNLIIVGGSCINTAAATVLGGAYCGAAFTEATNVGPGQFLIKAYDGAFTEGKIALVVAGYEAADTVNAATYLRTQTVDTSSAYMGSSSTSAELIVA